MALGTPDALENINLCLSPRRVFILEQLATVLPNTTSTLASNDKATKDKFREWTGQTQESLQAAWDREGFTRQENGTYKRDGAGAVTTSCEGLIGAVWNKIEQGGFGKRRGGATSFNLAGNDPKTGREKAPPPGWNWWRSMPSDPLPGDMFQIGTEVAPNQWSHAHVGVLTYWSGGVHPMWETVEAGQGGPGRGYDFMQRKALRLVMPISTKEPRKQIMGFLDIDAYFS